MKFIITTLLALPFAASAQDLSLSSYVDQVKSQDDDYVAAQKQEQAETALAREGRILLSPNLFANASHTDDSKPSLLFDYDKQITTNYQLGFSQQTSFGVSGRLYYNWLDQQYRNMSFGGTPPLTITGEQGSPTLELTIPIWRNLFGRETMGNIDQNDAGTAARKFTDSFKLKTTLQSAESAYWALSLARETVKVQKDALERAVQLNKWNSTKADSGLADRADVLQTQAAVEGRRLDLKSAQDDEQNAARAFNSLRGRDSSAVDEKLAPMSTDRLSGLAIPARAELRDDTRAALEQKRANVAGAQTSLEKYKPTLEIFGTAALNNATPTDTGNAFNNSWDTNKPTDTIGIRFNAPLDLGLINDAKQGWSAKLKASEIEYQRRLFDQEQQWNGLKDKFQQAKDRLTIYDQLEKTQKTKLEYERVRRQRGRTTTQQVLLFEQDYEQAQLGRIKTMSDILQLLAQMKTYGSTP